MNELGAESSLLHLTQELKAEKANFPRNENGTDVQAETRDLMSIPGFMMTFQTLPGG